MVFLYLQIFLLYFDHYCYEDEIVHMSGEGCLTLKHRETHGCVVSTVATDALVLKHQAISILSTD